jgi:uncharacterized protein YabE (DUF348 family)
MSKITNVAKKLSTKKLFATVIALVLILTVFTSTVLADVPNQYDVKVVDAGEPMMVTTAKLQASEVLSGAGIEVESDDLVDETNFVAGEGGEIVISRLNTIDVEFEGNTQSYDVYSATVGEALSEIGATLEKKDKTNYSSDAKVEEGMDITILSAASVSLTDGGKTIKYAISRGTVSDVLKLAGVKLGKNDYTEPALDKKIKANSKVKVFRVEYKNEVKSETIKYTTKTVNDSSMKKGTKKVVTKGVNGKKDVTYKVKYVNGKSDGKTKVSETVTKAAVQEVVKVGTKKTSKNGISEGDVISGRYTHYCACATCNGNSRGVTSSGRRIRNGMSNPHYVACNWLPLGTVIKVDGTKYTVVDRGGSGLSKKGRIDIFTPEGHAACYRLGTGSCKIKIVRLGW